jgi:thiosulfate/3-mercaptopyruvate sulfurtransferase
MKRQILLLLLLTSITASAQTPPLLAPAELSARLNDASLRVLDIREQGTELPRVPGAVSAPYSEWRGPPDDPGRPPGAAVLTRLLRRLGIDDTSSVVVVHEGASASDFGAAARVYWTLKTAGITRVAILNGGMTAWQAAGLPMATESVSPAPSRYEPRLETRWLATRAQVAEAMAAGSPWRLLDARPAAYFLGDRRHPAARAPGTLVGAKNVEHSVWFVPDTGVLASTEAIQATARRLGIDPQTPTVSFCNTGHWAATQWFVLSEILGGREVRLYPESMVDWSRSGGAMDNVPSRLQQFRRQLRAAFNAG